MKINKKQTETYVLSDLPGLDPVTVFVENFEPGIGRIVIHCWGKAWANYWGAMGCDSIQEFFCWADNEYLINKFIETTCQTDFEEIEKRALAKGFEICVDSDVEVAMCSQVMAECFGNDWYMDLPRRTSDEAIYLGRIIDQIKIAFETELHDKSESA